MDELIAWTDIVIPEAVFRGETHEDWHPLSGKQGEDLEGFINLVLSFAPHSNTQQPIMGGPTVFERPMPVYISTPQQYPPGTMVVTQTPAQPPMPAPQFNEADFAQITEMFPNMEKDVVKSIYEVNHFNKDITINSLLQLSSGDN